MFVSVIIPVYNDCERLNKCLAALAAQSYPREQYEIIVIDNGRNEGIEAAVGKSGYRLVAPERNLGDASRNKGIAIARGEILAFTDSDCIPAPDWIEKGVKRLLATPNCGLVAGRIEWHFRKPGCPTAVEWYDSISYLHQRKYIEQYGFGVTANLFTTRAVIDKVGGFDDSLMYLGDFEWGIRVRHHGYANVYADDAVISHAACDSLLRVCRRVARHSEAFYRLSRRKEEWLVSHRRQCRGTTAAVWFERFIGEIRRAVDSAVSVGACRRFQFILIHAIVKSVKALKLGRALL